MLPRIQPRSSAVKTLTESHAVGLFPEMKDGQKLTKSITDYSYNRVTHRHYTAQKKRKELAIDSPHLLLARHVGRKKACVSPPVQLNWWLYNELSINAKMKFINILIHRYVCSHFQSPRVTFTTCTAWSPWRGVGLNVHVWVAVRTPSPSIATWLWRRQPRQLCLRCTIVRVHREL